MPVFSTTALVKGLNKDLYLIHNPIFVDVEGAPSDTRYITVVITPQDWDTDAGPEPQELLIRLRPYDGKTYFDLARYIRGLMPSPKHPKELVHGMAIPRNLIKCLISINVIDNDGAVTDSRSYVKTFIRGGHYTRETNLTLASEALLSPCPTVPYWPGFPFAVYKHGEKGFIQFQSSIFDTSVLDERRKVGCDPLYLRFLNRLGGYSFWLFESYEISKKTSKTTVIERRGDLRTTGNTADYSISMRTRVERKYFGFMRNLAESPEVAVYNLDAILADKVSNTFIIKGTFVDVVNNGNKVDTPGQAEYLDLSFKFDVVLTHNPQVKW